MLVDKSVCDPVELARYNRGLPESCARAAMVLPRNLPTPSTALFAVPVTALGLYFVNPSIRL